MSRFTACLLVAASSVLSASGAEEIKIDSYQVRSERPPEGATVMVRPFDASDADMGKLKKAKQKETAKNMESIAPTAFREGLVQRLTESGIFGEVLSLDGEPEAMPAEALIIEGRFTVLDPGNRAKRYWVGLGAGKAKICVEGRVVDATGEELATFGDCRSGTGMWSFVGGKAEGMMTNDLFHTAFNTADFLAAWARGELRASGKTKN